MLLLVGSDADNIRYDQTHHSFVVGFGDKHDVLRKGTAFPRAGLVEIDVPTGDVVSTVTLPAHAESFQLQESRLFVNLPEHNHTVGVVDRAKNELTDVWSIIDPSTGQQLKDNFPMVLLPPPRRRLIVACRDPPMLAMLDTDSGRVVAAIAGAGDSDDVWFDSITDRVYQTGGDGYLVTLQLKDDDLEMISNVSTAPVARTSYFDELKQKIYVGVPKLIGHPSDSDLEDRNFNAADNPAGSIWVYDVS